MGYNRAMRVGESVELGAIPKYPRAGHDFPRRDIPVTPQEVLYGRRVLSAIGRVRMIPTGQTVVRQPRLETELYLMRSD